MKRSQIKIIGLILFMALLMLTAVQCRTGGGVEELQRLLSKSPVADIQYWNLPLTQPLVRPAPVEVLEYIRVETERGPYQTDCGDRYTLSAFYSF